MKKKRALNERAQECSRAFDSVESFSCSQAIGFAAQCSAYNTALRLFCLLSALVVLITTYPELSRYGTWDKEHQIPQMFSDPLTKSDEQSRKFDEAGVSLGECCSISATTEIVEHTYPASSAGPVEQDPCVPPVQIDQMLDSSALPETIWNVDVLLRNHLQQGPRYGRRHFHQLFRGSHRNIVRQDLGHFDNLLGIK